MFNQLFSGAGFFVSGLRLVLQPGIKRYALIPLLVNIILFGSLLYLGYSYFNDFLQWLLPDENGWLSWLRWILVPLFFISAFVFVFFTFAMVANTLAAPFNSMLSAAVEKHLTGKTLDSMSWKHLLKSILPMIFAEIKKFGYYLLILIPFLILFLIPVINLIAPFTWILVSAWVLAVQYTDYPIDNHNIKFSELRKRLGRQRSMAYGFGGGVMFAMTIPIVNFFVMPIAVAGATALAVEHLSLEQTTTA